MEEIEQNDDKKSSLFSKKFHQIKLLVPGKEVNFVNQPMLMRKPTLRILKEDHTIFKKEKSISLKKALFHTDLSKFQKKFQEIEENNFLSKKSIKKISSFKDLISLCQNSNEVKFKKYKETLSSNYLKNNNNSPILFNSKISVTSLKDKKYDNNVENLKEKIEKIKIDYSTQKDKKEYFLLKIEEIVKEIVKKSEDNKELEIILKKTNDQYFNINNELIFHRSQLKKFNGQKENFEIILKDNSLENKERIYSMKDLHKTNKNSFQEIAIEKGENNDNVVKAVSKIKNNQNVIKLLNEEIKLKENMRKKGTQIIKIIDVFQEITKKIEITNKNSIETKNHFSLSPTFISKQKRHSNSNLFILKYNFIFINLNFL